MYDDPIDVEVIAKRIGDVKQFYIQHAGVRPFGVSIIFGGIDKNGNRLFVTDPSGSCRGYKAVAVGVGREKVEGILKIEYRREMRLDEAVRLAIKCLVRSSEARNESPRVKIAVIPAETKKFTQLTEEEVEKHKKAVA